MALFGAKKTTASVTPAKTKESKEVKEKAPVAMKDLYAATPAKGDKAKAAKIKGGLSHELSARVLVKPLITEKATHLGAENKYVFVVSGSANKITVAKAVATIYGVKPLAVNIINSLGKRVKRGRVSGKRKDWRKAVITLKKGETIKVYEGV